MTYRYVGYGPCDMGFTALTQFGQKVELTPEQAADVLGPTGAVLLPEKDFESIGFTDAELKSLASILGKINPPDALKAKVAKAHQLYHDSVNGKGGK